MATTVRKNNFPAEKLDYCIYGNAVQMPFHYNIARDALLFAKLSHNTPAQTIAMACISSLQCLGSAFDMIKSGTYNSILTGGVDSLSDAPIRRSKLARKEQVRHQFGMKNDLDHIEKLTRPLRFYGPENVFINEFISGLSMTEDCENMCELFSISREEADGYALLSNQRAKAARDNQKLTDNVQVVLSNGTIVSEDNYIRVSSLEELAKLQPVAPMQKSPTSNKQVPRSILSSGKHGIITAGNATGFTDGASSSILINEATALELKVKPIAFMRDYIVTAQDPITQLLMGPAYSIPKLLNRHNMTFNDIDVFEIHEAFAGQLLSVLKALNNKEFLSTMVKTSKDLGTLSVDRINLWGGSLALGHPFAATGSRLINMAANQLIDANKRYAVVSACAAGGQSIAILLERYPV